MKVIDCVQGEPLWLKSRLGVATASEFSKILTPTGKLSAQASSYAQQLVAEELIGEPIKDLDNLYWVERGKMMEPDAVELYEFETGNKTTQVGFITNDAGTIGCSPDRFTDKGGLLEIKCPAPQTHIAYMVDGIADKYKPQVQGQLYITDLEVCELFSYHPDLPPVRIITKRDDEYIKKLADSLNDFVEMKAKLLAKIKSMGTFGKKSEYGRELMAG